MRVSSPQDYIERARVFVRDYTAGLTLADLRRLFDREAARAYAVLKRDQPAAAAEPANRLPLALYRAKVIFLGLSYKLSPPRRALFAASLLCALLGVVDPIRLDTGWRGGTIAVDFSPVWFLGAIGGLLFVLVLELVDRIRVRDEIEVARQLQHELLPAATPELPGWTFAHAWRTANEVGGDCFDYLPVPPRKAGEQGRLAIVVADASGHGIAAGLLMAVANATLKTAVDLDPDPVRVATLLNRTLCRTGDRRAFMSLFYALLEPSNGRLEFVCAGHPFPLLRRAGGEIDELGEGGLPLGIHASLPLARHEVSLAPGDVLLLYTDGLPEAVAGSDGEAFGFLRLRELLAAPAPPVVLKERILLAFEEHVGREALGDDVTVLVVGRDRC